MRCIFIGVGEAFDPRHPNTSLLVSAGETTLLADCGFTAAASYFLHAPNPDALDAVYISHFHGDHFFGLPYLLTAFREDGRTRELAIIGQSGVRDIVEEALSLAYPSFLGKAQFNLRFMTATPKNPLRLGDFELNVAPSDHSAPCLAVRLDAGGRSLFYSGDGGPTPQTSQLARGCGLIVHEAYGLAGTAPGHGSVGSSLDFARKAGAAHVALVHVQRNVRLDRLADIRNILANCTEIHAFLPESSDVFDVGA